MGYKPKTVLIVEDEPHNRTFLLDLLIAHGFSTLVATDATEGLQLGLYTRPDVVLMDMGLPGIDGWALTRCLTRSGQYCGAPIIAISAWARLGDEQRALDAGCAAYLQKPIDADKLLRVLREVLTSGREPS